MMKQRLPLDDRIRLLDCANQAAPASIEKQDLKKELQQLLDENGLPPLNDTQIQKALDLFAASTETVAQGKKSKHFFSSGQTKKPFFLRYSASFLFSGGVLGLLFGVGQIMHWVYPLLLQALLLGVSASLFIFGLLMLKCEFFDRQIVAADPELQSLTKKELDALLKRGQKNESLKKMSWEKVFEYAKKSSGWVYFYDPDHRSLDLLLLREIPGGKEEVGLLFHNWWSDGEKRYAKVVLFTNRFSLSDNFMAFGGETWSGQRFFYKPFWVGLGVVRTLETLGKRGTSRGFNLEDDKLRACLQDSKHLVFEFEAEDGFEALDVCLSQKPSPEGYLTPKNVFSYVTNQIEQEELNWIIGPILLGPVKGQKLFVFRQGSEKLREALKDYFKGHRQKIK